MSNARAGFEYLLVLCDSRKKIAQKTAFWVCVKQMGSSPRAKKNLKANFIFRANSELASHAYFLVQKLQVQKREFHFPLCIQILAIFLRTVFKLCSNFSTANVFATLFQKCRLKIVISAARSKWHRFEVRCSGRPRRQP